MQQLLDLPVDALALIISCTDLPKDGRSLRLTCRFWSEAVNMGARLACAQILSCKLSEVPEHARAASGEDALRTAAFVTHSHNGGQKLAAAHDHSLVARGNLVLSCGANDAGQLGIGRVSQFNSTIIVPNTPHAAVYAARQQQMVEGFDPATPQPALLALPAGVTITSLAAGRSHSLAATSDGQLFAWGLSHACGLAPPTTDLVGRPRPSMQATPSPKAVTLDVTDDDDPPTTLRHMANEEALAHAVGLCALHVSPTPSRARWVIEVAAGQLHSAFLLFGGAVFCCGAGSAGELGDGQMMESSAPVRARLPEGARAIAAGGFHTLAIGAGPSRRVYGWGSAACRQLGDYSLVEGSVRRLGGLAPSQAYGQSTPTALAIFDMATVRKQREHDTGTVTWQGEATTSEGVSESVLASAFQGVAPATAMLLEEQSLGTVVGGDPSAAAPEESSLWIDYRELPPCAQLAAGCHHTLLLTQRGHVISCGKNSNGQLGLGVRMASNAPTVVAALAHTRIVSIAAGASHSAFVDEEGSLYTCGRIANGRLGFDEAMVGDAPASLVRTAADNAYTRAPMHHCARPTTVVFPGGPRRVRMVACGNDHTIVLMADGRAFSFGRGQAGQLASGSRNDRLQPEELLPLAASHARQEAGDGAPGQGRNAADDACPEHVRTTAGASGTWRSGSCVATFTRGAPEGAAEKGADEPTLTSTSNTGTAPTLVPMESQAPAATYKHVCRSFSRW